MHFNLGGARLGLGRATITVEKRFSERFTDAFSRVELCSAISAVCLLALIARPLLANNDGAQQRAVCANNLRQIGQAVLAKASEDTQGRAIWWVPIEEGGYVSGTLRAGQAWFTFAGLSNELKSPQVMACPADSGVTAANNWFDYRWNYRQNAESYTINAHGGRAPVDVWISADRNVRYDAAASVATPCFPIGIANANVVKQTNSEVAWTNKIHGTFGNVLRFGGAVEFTSTDRLRELMQAPELSDTGIVHVINSR